MDEEPAIKRILDILSHIQNIEPLNMVLFTVDNDPDEHIVRLSVVWEFERS